MWLALIFYFFHVIYPALVHAIVTTGSSSATAFATGEDISPDDLELFHPDQNDCPLPCVEFDNIHSWTSYFSVDRLKRCDKPMLLQFSVSEPLDQEGATIHIRSCTLASKLAPRITIPYSIRNPQKAESLPVPLKGTNKACITPGVVVQNPLKLASSSDGTGDGATAAALLDGMRSFFNATYNCDESFVFAYHRNIVATIYIGSGLGKLTVDSAAKALASRLHEDSNPFNRTVTELCDSSTPSERIFGISLEATGNLAAVQKTALGWSQGHCALNDNLTTGDDLVDIGIWDVSLAGNTNTHSSSFIPRFLWRGEKHKRATCRYLKINLGDDCPSLIKRCGIESNDFTKFNPKSNLCSTLRPNDCVCCSSGDPRVEPRSEPPKKSPDGTCAAHLIKNGHTCASIAKQYGITVENIEKWNKGKTWAWSGCNDMLIGYNLCVSDGGPPMPPPQAGTQCGPLMPGTKPPTDKSISLAELNPCPLKACCSNWGFCGVFPAHCSVHRPEGGGPGSKKKGFENTCVSNCGNEIKKNSGPPASFQRIGYYESYNFNRDCLWMKAKHANTDGTYTHMHWGFADIDPKTWKPIIKDSKNQWEDFKKLPNMKRIVSFGGWAYSTEPATYNIIRSAIIDHSDKFAANLATWAKVEGIDGIDIDWEYPGAPDIMVGDQPIGKKSDGQDYLKFLTTLKNTLGPNKSVSIAAPASYWYLKAFPIDKIAAVIDYIVYMTYDLHGQWDYGNPNAYDMCPSGKCIRSHVNLTETRNALSMITKAGVPNNKIFVGEASYGRSFRMAKDGCWGPMCDFTGSRTKSNANPGRCTKEGGYLAFAEINEIIRNNPDAKVFHDDKSNTDVLLYKGDYVSYMTPTTKETRRNDWKSLNFAGSIDWAVDLQSFGADDIDVPTGRPKVGQEGCVSGEDSTLNTGDLCEFSCSMGFCPESLCTCTETDELEALPPQKNVSVAAWDEFDVDLNRLCKFACALEYCPEDICRELNVANDENSSLDTIENFVDISDLKRQNAKKCLVYKDPEMRDVGLRQCELACSYEVSQAKSEGQPSNYGCLGFWPLEKPIPWNKAMGGGSETAPGECLCNNWLINEFAEVVLDLMPAVGQIGCYVIMSTIKTLLDVGLQFVPGVGKVLDAALDMTTTAAQLAAYLYPEEEDPEGAFSWWLSPCGGTNLVPEDIKRAYEILSTVTDGVTSFKTPKNIKKGSGKKGDDGNPTDRGKKRPMSTPNNPGPAKKKCFIAPSSATRRVGGGKHTLRMESCVNDKTQVKEFVVTSVTYAQAAKPTQVAKECSSKWGQACYHYSSAIKVNPQWATLTCPPEAATTAHRLQGGAVDVWKKEHSGGSRGKDNYWMNTKHRQGKCDRDEFPPAYLLGPNDPAYIFSGKNSQGQLVRWLPQGQNRGAGSMWKGACFASVLKDMTDADFERQVSKNSKAPVTPRGGRNRVYAGIDVNVRPEFTISKWGQSPAPDDGLRLNPCWPKKLTANDPGFTLLTYDPFYQGQTPAGPFWDYTEPYKKGVNGD